jgi:hypothetical protein
LCSAAFAWLPCLGILCVTIAISAETFAPSHPYASTLAHGRLFLATPGEFPDCMKMQSGFLLGLAPAGSEPDQQIAQSAWRTSKLVEISGIHF